MACYHSAGIFLLTFAVAVAIAVDIASAKRGCSSFGHSCFGGHGKRADEDFLPQPDYEIPAELSDPRSQDKPVVTLSKADIVPLLRQWLMTYRRSADAK